MMHSPASPESACSGSASFYHSVGGGSGSSGDGIVFNYNGAFGGAVKTEPLSSFVFPASPADLADPTSPLADLDSMPSDLDFLHLPATWQQELTTLELGRLSFY